MVAAGTTAASGSGSMTPIPTAAATLGPYVIATPSTAALELAYAPPAEADADDQLREELAAARERRRDAALTARPGSTPDSG